jgi:hypothetical protein
MGESWTPWKHCSDGLPEPGDYVRLKCPCLGFYREGVYLGTFPDGRVKIAPKKEGTAVYCYWSRRNIGDLSEIEREHEEERV